MKVLVVGSDKVYAIENLYVRYMRMLDADIFHFPAQSIFYDHYDKGMLPKLMFKAGLSGIYGKINRQLLEKVEALKPEAIWFFKGMEIFPGTLEQLRAKGIRIVNYNPDNPFVFSGKGSGNKNVTDSIGLFDLHFTYNLDIRDQLQSKYPAIPVAYLPFGFDVSDAIFEQCIHQEEVQRICFLGNPDEARAKFILQMAEGGLPFDIYGHNWDRFVRHENIRLCDPVYGDELWKTLRRYRAQLNLMRTHNPGSHNMRSFEVPGIGGILLAPETREHALFFQHGEEAFLYKDIEHAIGLGRQLLELSQAEAEKIRQKARERSILSGYSYKDRAAFAYGKIKELVYG